MNLLASFAGLRIAHHEAFLVGADGGADHLLGDREERLVERAHQHHRPFDQAGDLGQQALVLDQFEALRERQVLGVGQDHLRAARRIDHDLGRVELGDIVVEPLHLDRRWRQEAMAVGGVAAAMPPTRTARLRAPRSRARTSRRSNAAAAPSSARRAWPTPRPSASTSARETPSPPPARCRRSPRSPGGRASRSPRRRSRPSCRAAPWPDRSMSVPPRAEIPRSPAPARRPSGLCAPP